MPYPHRSGPLQLTDGGHARSHCVGAYVFNALGRGVPRLCPSRNVGRLCVGVPLPVLFIDVGFRLLSLLNGRGLALYSIQFRYHGACRLAAFINLLLHPFEFVCGEIDREHQALLAAF
jgi:hypothetical protein